MGVSWLELPPRPIVLGHRGARHAHPENTMRAFQAALDEGAVGTEFDVMLTSDGVPVVFHDFDLARMTGRRDVRRVSALTSRELNSITLDGGEYIPTLKTVLDWAVKTDALLNIELKSERPWFDPVANVVAGLLDGYPDAPDFALVSSFHPTLVRRFAGLKPNVVSALLVGQNHPCLLHDKWLAACGAHAVHPQASLLLRRPQLLQRVGSALVNTWTVNSEQQAIALGKLGVAGIITDRPRAIVTALTSG